MLEQDVELHQQKPTLARKILTMQLVVLIGAIIAASATFLYQGVSSLGNAASLAMSQASQHGSHVLVTFLQTTTNNLARFVQDPLVSAYIRHNNMRMVFGPAFAQAVRSVQESLPALCDVVLFSEGERLFSLSDEEFMAEGWPRESAEPQVGVMLDPATKKLLMVIQVTVREDGLDTSHLLSVFDVVALQASLFKENTLPWEGQFSLEAAPESPEALGENDWAGESVFHSVWMLLQGEGEEWIRHAEVVHELGIQVVAAARAARVLQPVWTTLGWIAITALVVTALGGLFTRRAALRLTHSLWALTKAVRRFAAEGGEVLEIRSDVREVALLSHSFSGMASDIATRIDDLEFLRQLGQALGSTTTQSEIREVADSHLLPYFQSRGIQATLELGQGKRECPQNVENARILIRPSTNEAFGSICLQHVNGKRLYDSGRLAAMLDVIGENFELSIEKACALSEHIAQAVLAAEIDRARLVQQVLMDCPAQIVPHSWQTDSHFEPASRIGGDLLRVLRDDTRNIVRVFIGDVTGHGVASALVASAVAATIDLLDAPESSEETLSGARIMERLNQVVRRIGGGEYLMTMCIMEVSLSDGTFRIFNAGHCSPLLLLPAGAGGEAVPLVRRLVARGSWLGFYSLYDSQTRVGMIEGTLAPGQSLVVFTDGLIETTNNAGDPFGYPRLRSSLNALSAEPFSGICDKVAGVFHRFREDAELTDDVCMMAIHRKPVA